MRVPEKLRQRVVNFIRRFRRKAPPKSRGDGDGNDDDNDNYNQEHSDDRRLT